MSINFLPAEVQSRLRSGIAITCPRQCAEELVLNALDASATCIAVRIDLKHMKIQVIDNGNGISYDQLKLVGERYATSKCHSLKDLDKIQWYGYRGEALASIRDVAGVLEIVSRSKKEKKSFCKIFTQGKAMQIKESVTERPSIGTTCTVYNFLHNLPVRRKNVQQVLDLDDIRTRIESIALIHPEVAFSLRNDVTGAKCIQTNRCNSVLTNFSNLFGADRAKCLKSVRKRVKTMWIEGFVSSEGYHKKNLQFIYVNKRLVLRTNIDKIVNSCFSKFFSSRKFNSPQSPGKNRNKYAIFVLNFVCPLKDYDVCFEPSKTFVEFADWDLVTQCIEEALRDVWCCEKDTKNSKGVEKCDTKVVTDLRSLGNRIITQDVRNVLTSLPAKRKISENLNNYDNGELMADVGGDFESANGFCDDDNEKMLMEPDRHLVKLSKLRSDLVVTSLTDYVKKVKGDSFRKQENGGKRRNVLKKMETRHQNREKKVTSLEKFVFEREKFKSHSLNREPVKPNLAIFSNFEPVKPNSAIFSNREPVKPNSAIFSNREPVKPNSAIFRDREPVESNSAIFNNREPVNPNSSDLTICESVKSNSSIFNIRESHKPNSSVEVNFESVNSCSSLILNVKDRLTRLKNRIDEEKLRQIFFLETTTQSESEYEINSTKSNLFMSNDEDLEWRNEPIVQLEESRNIHEISSLECNQIESNTFDVDGETFSEKFPQIKDGDLPISPIIGHCEDSFNLNLTISISDDSHLEQTAEQINEEIKESNWIAQKDENLKKIVYINKITGNSTFSPPPVLNEKEKNEINLPEFPCEVYLGSAAAAFNSHTTSIRCNDSRQKQYDDVDDDQKWRNGERRLLADIFDEFEHNDAVCLQSPIPVYNLIHPYTFTREMLRNFKVINQIDKKFIACILKPNGENSEIKTNLVVLFDQHAVHERVRLEQLQAEMESEFESRKIRVKCTTVDPPMDLSLRSNEIEIVRAFLPVFTQWGFELSIDVTDLTLVKVHTLPNILAEREVNEQKRKRQPVLQSLVQKILEDIVSELRNSGSCSTIPKSLLRVLHSRACRGAVKFGDFLDKSECEDLIELLQNCRLPFQCAHGRPSISPILDLNLLHQFHEIKCKKRPRLWKLHKL